MDTCQIISAAVLENSHDPIRGLNTIWEENKVTWDQFDDTCREISCLASERLFSPVKQRPGVRA